MNDTPRLTRCAVYARESTEHNLDLAFTSLDAQREACEAYIRSQAGEGWRLLPGRYDDGGLSGASLDRPAVQRMLNQKGFNVGDPDGVFGPRTHDGLMEFQRSAGLPATGEIDNQTCSALGVSATTGQAR